MTTKRVSSNTSKTTKRVISNTGRNRQEDEKRAREQYHKEDST